MRKLPIFVEEDKVELNGLKFISIDQVKIDLQKQIDIDTKKYKASGGKIEKVPTGITKDCTMVGDQERLKKSRARGSKIGAKKGIKND